MSVIRSLLLLLPLCLATLSSNVSAQGATENSQKLTVRNDSRALLSEAEKFRQQQQFCEEEKLIAEPWIRWGSENRALCLTQSRTAAERDACIQSVMNRLDELKKEHAATYATQSRHVTANLPLMRSLLERLSENTRTAALAVQGDAEPGELSSMRLQNCMVSR